MRVFETFRGAFLFSNSGNRKLNAIKYHVPGRWLTRRIVSEESQSLLISAELRPLVA
jgi:hypothetical protein